MFVSIGIVIAAVYLFGSWMHGAAVAVLILIWTTLPVQRVRRCCSWR